MYKNPSTVYLISFLSFFVTVSILILLPSLLTQNRLRVLDRLQGLQLTQVPEEEDILKQPFLERTLGYLTRWIVNVISQITPKMVKEIIENKLANAGNPQNLKSIDLLAIQGVLGFTMLILSLLVLTNFAVPLLNVIQLSLVFTALTVYLPWFILGRMATKRQMDIQRSLSDISDFLVICVEAGLSFEMALLRVLDQFHGTVAIEFQKTLREIQLGKPRKDALKDMSKRVNLGELSALVTAVIQSDQLGVGIGHILRIQSDLIREKRQQFIEEQGMKAPIKMLFPMIFFIFPCILIIIQGPTILYILKMLANK